MKRVLVVDDEERLCDVIKVVLEDENVNVWTTTTIEGAIGMLRQHFDVILTDLEMPEKDGFYFLEYLRTIGHSARRVAMSGNSNLREKALAAGAHQFLGKPFEMEELYSAVDS